MYNNRNLNNNYYQPRYRRNRGRKTSWPRIMGALAVALLVLAGAAWVMGFFDDKGEEVRLDEPAVQQETVARAETRPAKEKKGDDTKAVNGAEGQDFGEQDYRIEIHKLAHKLELYHRGDDRPVKVYACAVAKNVGDKHKAGDDTTPTSWGDVAVSIPGAAPRTDSSQVPFVVDEICYAADWTHDFGDGKGEIPGAYGKWFISLNTGWDGIGIHGTHDPSSIGTNASEGCIRLYNEDLNELKAMISQNNGGVGVKVAIMED